MARYDARCIICSDSAKVALVERELAAGSRPADVLREYGDQLGCSSASLYRHCASHRPQTPLGVQYLPDGETTLGDFVGGAVRDWVSLGVQRERALERGHDAAATAAARARAQAAEVIAKYLAIDDASWAEALESFEEFVRFIQRSVRDLPELGDLLTAAAIEQGNSDLAGAFESLTERAREHQAQQLADSLP